MLLLLLLLLCVYCVAEVHLVVELRVPQVVWDEGRGHR